MWLHGLGPPGVSVRTRFSKRSDAVAAPWSTVPATPAPEVPSISMTVIPFRSTVLVKSIWPGLFPTASVPLMTAAPTVPDPERVAPLLTVVRLLVEMLPLMTSVPPATVVAPEKLLVLDSVRVPAPFLVMPPVPVNPCEVADC